MKTYAGIGSENITPEEASLIQTVAFSLFRRGYILFSGNCVGADMNFQIGSQGQCVLMLPFADYNAFYNNCLDKFVLGDSESGKKLTEKFHPNKRLSDYAKKMMNRNAHQILGYGKYPPVSFVVFCADEKNGIVSGGTAQAVKIARAANIPVFNLRGCNLDAMIQFIVERN